MTSPAAPAATAAHRAGPRRRLAALALGGCLLAAGLAGCTPTVAVRAPEEPIVIHMNVKIEHEIRVKVEKDLEQAFETNEEIF